MICPLNMKPIKFKGCNSLYAKDQPEYRPLPAHKSLEGIVTSCWSLSILERVKALLFGRVYIQNLTFNQPLQPQLLSVSNPIKT